MKFFITGCESFVAKNLIKELERKNMIILELIIIAKIQKIQKN